MSISGIVNLSDTLFTGTANFKNSDFRKDLFLNGTGYYKLEIHWDDIENKLRYDESVFRLLIKNFKKWGQYEDAQRCYIFGRNNLTISFLSHIPSSFPP